MAKKSNDAHTPIRANDVFCQVKRIKTAEHLGTYNEYINKEDGLTIQSMQPKQLVEITEMWNEMTRKQINGRKGGRIADIAKSMVVSLPPYMEAKIDRSNKKQMEDFVEYVINDLTEGIVKQYPKVNPTWLKRNMSISLHYDTDHTHFHVLMPSYAKSKGLMQKHIKIDYQQRGISTRTRRSAYNWCKRTLKTPELTTEDFIRLAQEEERRPKRLSKGELRENLEKELLKAVSLNYDRMEAIKELDQTIADNQKWIKKFENAFYRIETNLAEGKYTLQEALNKFDNLESTLESTTDENLKSSMKNNLKNTREVLKRNYPNPGMQP